MNSRSNKGEQKLRDKLRVPVTSAVIPEEPKAKTKPKKKKDADS